MRMMLMLLGTCWLLGGAFMVFQYYREKEYKADLLDTRLQMHNSRILNDLQRGEKIEDIVGRINAPAENLRVTLIGRDGGVIYDSRQLALHSNHNSRPEVKAARASGTGRAIARMSESDEQSYFYSALACDGGLVIRSAAPYGHTLAEFLAVDRTILWIMGGMTLAITLLGLIVTRRVSVSIRELSRFAERAGRGERIYSGQSFPRDELGDIAANIVRLYVERDEQHRAAMRAEKDKARLKKELTNNINHELKTPVASILVSLDLLTDHPDLPAEKREEIIGRVRGDAERLNSLLRDVSVLTRLEEAPDMIEKKRLDLKALVEEVAEDARRRTDMRIITEIAPLEIEGDRRLLESIFRNLTENAIAYSGGTELHITGDSEGRFRLWDNGRGIAPEHLPHIFERFYRVDTGRSRDTGGTGLGLSIVRNAVAFHGGEIKVRSVKGLFFEFTLPPATGAPGSDT